MVTLLDNIESMQERQSQLSRAANKLKWRFFKFLIGYQYMSIVLAILFRKMKFMLLKLLVQLAKDTFMMIWTALII